LRLALAILVSLQTLPIQALSIRLWPDEEIFLNASARRVGIRDLMLQNVGIVNDDSVAVELQLLEITAYRYGQPILTERVALPLYQYRWKGLYDYFVSPGTLESQNSIYGFSRLLAGGIDLSPNMELVPMTAITIHKRLLSFSDYERPDSIRLRASAVSDDGRSHLAEATLKVREYEQRNEYVLPVGGRWYLASAPSPRGHHRIRPAHEFALDFIQIGEDGSSYSGDGSSPEDYYAFGEEVVAAADGVVLRAVKDIPETEMPRSGESCRDFAVRVLDAMWTADPSGRIAEGNQVILAHEGGEHSVYVHLRQGSVRVTEGERVKQGQVIGEVGISGDGFQPHLHFQVNDGPEPQFSRGLPVIFANARPVPFSSTIDMKEERLYMAGEFIETVD